MNKNPSNIPEELANRFPKYLDRIAQLLEKNDAFMEIVDDYRFCINKLSRLQDHPGEVNPLREHYQNTVLDLEEEMMVYFAKDTFIK